MAKSKYSIVDYLDSQGQDSSYSARKKLATDLGISNYSGSDTQNLKLLDMLKSGNTTNNSAKTNNDVKASNNTPSTSNTPVTKTSDDVKNTVKGVDGATAELMDSKFNQSQESKDRDKKAEVGLSNLESLVGKDQIISDSVWNSINSSFSVPSAVREADMYLAQQLEKIQSGKTSYSDQVKDMMDKIMNREKFSYDVDTDPLFQQALASAMSSGKQAMQDTIGQASALTGGYGSTYATTAGNQAYNSFIEDAYDNLPQYYQMALEAYQMEGDEMYRQYGMLSAEDDKEYNRNVTAYDATYQHRNRMYDEAYNQYRDSVSDAFAMANLQLNEHGQLVSDAVNYYNAASDYADTLYQREYGKWSDEVSLAYKYAEMLNSDYWNESNQTFQATENQKERDWKSAEAEKERAFTASENAKNRSVKSSSPSGNGLDLTTSELNALKTAYQEGGMDAVADTLNVFGKPLTSPEQADLIEGLVKNSNSEASTPTATGTINGFSSRTNDNFDITYGGETFRVENHGKVTDSDTLKELKKTNVNNGSAFTYNGDVYVKQGDAYYSVGATNILLWKTNGYQNLLDKMQK